MLVLLVRPPARRLTAPPPARAGRRGAGGGDRRRASALAPRCRSRAVARQRADRRRPGDPVWGGWAVDVAKSQAIGAVLRRRGRRALSSACGAPVPGTGGCPGARRRRGFGVVSSYAGPVVLDPVFNQFTPCRPGEAAHGRARAGRARPASRWARSTRSTPRAARPRPTPTSPGWARRSASSSTTSCCERLHARRGAAGRRPRARPRPLPRRAAAGCCGWRWWRPFGMLRRRSGWPSAWRRARAARPATRAAGRRPLPRAARAGALGVVSNQLSRRVEAPRRHASRSSLTRDPRPFSRFERRIARPERLRSRSARLARRTASAPTRRRSSGSAPPWPSSAARARALRPPAAAELRAGS